MQNFIGQQIDRYRVTERLGMGGMAVVYKAYDTRLERDVAIKIIRTEAIPQEQHERLLKRFEREAKAQARFDHKHIVYIYDYGDVGGAPYLVMSYIPGGTLKLRTGQPVPYPQALGWLIPIADALHYAHQRGVIHRDIKPSNILFDSEDQPVLTDFGIAKILEGNDVTLTGTGLGVGTPEYMAPEQWQGKATPATDQYALGVVLYELITGQKPYTADTPAAVALMQMSEPLRSPRTLAPSIPEALEKLLYKAMARDPQDRYEDMHALRKALENVSTGEPITKTPLSSISDQPELKAKPVFEPKPDLKPELKLEPDPLRHQAPLRSFDSEGETRDMLDTGTGVRAVHANGSIEKKRGKANWVLWGGVGLVMLIALTVGMVLLIRNLVTGLAAREGTASEMNLAVEELVVTMFESTLGIDSTMVNPVDGAEMVYVPAGEFLMGSEDDDAENDESPEHTVYLDAYWIYQTEVTNAQYRQCVDEGECDVPSVVDQFNNPDFDDHPVVYVSWFDADTYCQWVGGRLPTEAEWEKAARGTDGRKFPWGDTGVTGEKANYCDVNCEYEWLDTSQDDGYKRTAPVGSYPNGASPYGALDMAGNVMEWVGDWYDGDYYGQSPSTNPQGPDSGEYRMLRGGSWFSNEWLLRASNRYGFVPGSGASGFRCFRSP